LNIQGKTKSSTAGRRFAYLARSLSIIFRL
jgi:hypothetical protein